MSDDDKMFNIFFVLVCLCGVALVATMIWAAVQIVQWVVAQ